MGGSKHDCTEMGGGGVITSKWTFISKMRSFHRGVGFFTLVFSPFSAFSSLRRLYHPLSNRKWLFLVFALKRQACICWHFLFANFSFFLDDLTYSERRLDRRRQAASLGLLLCSSMCPSGCTQRFWISVGDQRRQTHSFVVVFFSKNNIPHLCLWFCRRPISTWRNVSNTGDFFFFFFERLGGNHWGDVN